MFFFLLTTGVISSDEDKPVDEYIDMKPGAGGLESGGSSSSSFDDAGYLKMHPAEDRWAWPWYN